MEEQMEFKPGDFVIYQLPTGLPEFGKVKRLNEYNPNSVFVWFHAGDTAASTPKQFLTRITAAELADWRTKVINAYAIEEIIMMEV